MNTLAMVQEFNTAFRLDWRTRPNTHDPARAAAMDDLLDYAVKAHYLGRDLKERSAKLGGNTPLIRLQLIQEELAELAKGICEGDLVQILDALTDLQYVVDGAYLTFGLGNVKDAAFREVHRSNMSKLDEYGDPIIGPSGRVEKPPHYSRPDLAGILEGLMSCTT